VTGILPLQDKPNEVDCFPVFLATASRVVHLIRAVIQVAALLTVHVAAC